ncbi:unnamed protein product [Macrosiphum euphorbiae]|uniref:Integrase catalytic domain-containing protein n=1 Tax=Macrosiphum euphorbiae TaxID=13131 RepID=A0AAV0X4I2_9HEMI|nr:unnamed protein product [Macrosiphum euphorbiae]CAI6348733.1 unnamed protein product [Macrosiphum euphorbiae]CAI6363037.1 unnamed protein product [Macrosiphum euphorbiae]
MTAKAVNRKLKVIASELAALLSFSSQFDVSSGNINEVRARIESLPEVAERFELLQTELENLEEHVPDEQRVSERLTHKDLMFSVKASLMSLLESKQEKGSSAPSISEVTRLDGVSAMRLPPIDAPKFNGDWQMWTSFIDSFNAMFHKNKDLLPVQRLYYLKSCLQGQAREVISSIPTIGENYLQAYNTIVNRYENKGAIIQSHIRSLLDTPRVLTASATELQNLHHHIMSNVNALRAATQPVDSWDAWLVTLICSRMDSATVAEWQLHYNKKDLPSFTEIESFLFNRIAAYEAGEMNSHKGGSNPVPAKLIPSSFNKQKLSKFNDKKILFAKYNESKPKCISCNSEHYLFQCMKFKNLSVEERRDVVFKNRCCFNCLRSDHQVRQCRSSSCTQCGKRHNTLLHLSYGEQETDEPRNDDNQSDQGSSSASPNVVGCGMVNRTVHCKPTIQVILATVVVHVNDSSGNVMRCRAVLDSGSQLCFITNKLARRLGLQIVNNTVPITGIGQSRSSTSKCCLGTVQSRFVQTQFQVQLHVLPTITGDLPTQRFDTNQLNIPREIQSNLADPEYSKPGSVDMLLGAEIFFEILRQDKHFVSEHAAFQDTVFGWILVGKVLTQPSVLSLVRPVINQCSALSLFTSAVSRRLCEEEESVEQHFTQTTRRNERGQFVVRLPLKEHPLCIGNTSIIARKRFLNLEQKLIKDKGLSNEYDNFLMEYLKLGHMEKIGQFNETQSNGYYIPHHAVFKSTSTTTKLRVVFDASTIGSTGKSLNDLLMKGPVVQPTLYSTLLRFRVHQVALTADIEKMYRQILVHNDDCQLQKIVYRSRPTNELQEFMLKTVTYGTKTAPYLATRCLVQLGNTCTDPDLARIIQRDFYVDDLLTGADTEEQCYEIFQKLTSVLNGAQLPLRKWCSNSSTLLSLLPTTTDDNYIITLSESDSVSALGLQWQPSTDSFKFVMKPWTPPKRMTKRSLLSDINSIYDPIGLITPVLIKGKIFLQQLWSLKIDWDEVLSDDICSRWTTFYSSLHQLVELSVPRKVLLADVINLQIHGFCDASQLAFGACVYLRSVTRDGSVYVHLYTSKSRVAPLKATTIPRLELCGAVTSAELVLEVQAELRQLNVIVPPNNVFLWSDSTIVLAWIASTSLFQVYVSNRIARIRDLSTTRQWHHVPTNDNPADVISRGVDVRTITVSSLWWHGPSWLSQESIAWPDCPSLPTEMPEVKPVKFVLSASQAASPWLLESYSDWMKLLRISALVMRFISNCQIKAECKENRCVGFILSQELQVARNHWLRQAQAVAFPEDYSLLKNKQQVSRRSCLKQLSPFIDEAGLIRVGGRLMNASISSSMKHPIVLPSASQVTRLLFKYEHIRLLHVGPLALLSHINNYYWVIRGRCIARSTVSRCIQCFKTSPRFVSPFMAPLPRERVTIARPFARTGVDYCGPVMVRSGLRKVTPLKCYVCVFICLVTRAIHLELVASLSADDFLSTLSRFMARRGQCRELFSDNGTNFVGADRILRMHIQDCQKTTKVHNFLSSRGIDWHFIPPSAPHFGGIWEAAVKSAKKHLLRVSKGVMMTYDETTTLLCRIEAVLNSRPLTPLSSDPSDFTALTAGHFLIGGPLQLPPEPDCTGIPQNRLRRFQLMQAQAQNFWKRWSSEYLPQCQRRGKWTKLTRNIEVGDLAVLKNDNSPPLQWDLVRVTKVHPGPDGIVRAVTVQSSSGAEFKRPATKLAVLPTENDEVGEGQNMS